MRLCILVCEAAAVVGEMVVVANIKLSHLPSSPPQLNCMCSGCQSWTSCAGPRACCGRSSRQPSSLPRSVHGTSPLRFLILGVPLLSFWFPCLHMYVDKCCGVQAPGGPGGAVAGAAHCPRAAGAAAGPGPAPPPAARARLAAQGAGHPRPQHRAAGFASRRVAGTLAQVLGFFFFFLECCVWWYGWAVANLFGVM